MPCRCRVLSVREDVSYEELREKLEDMFESRLQISFRDDEDDLVTIKSEYELQEALNNARSSSDANRSVRLVLQRVSTRNPLPQGAPRDSIVRQSAKRGLTIGG